MRRVYRPRRHGLGAYRLISEMGNHAKEHPEIFVVHVRDEENEILRGAGALFFHASLIESAKMLEKLRFWIGYGQDIMWLLMTEHEAQEPEEVDGNPAFGCSRMQHQLGDQMAICEMSHAIFVLWQTRTLLPSPSTDAKLNDHDL